MPRTDPAREALLTALEAAGVLIPLWDGIVADTEYGADVTIKALLPEGKEGEFAKRVLDLTSGTVQATVTGESLKAVPVR